MVLAAGILVIAAVGIWGFFQARQFEAHATAGKAAALAGLDSLNPQDPAAAIEAFQTAGAEFSSARALLGPEWLHAIPWVGRQLAAADDLATIGVDGSTAGEAGAKLLQGVTTVSGDDQLNALIRLAPEHLDTALTALIDVSDRAAALSTDGVVSPLASAITEIKEKLAPLDDLVQLAPSMLDLERYLFSGQHRFLVVSQNGAELRPTGGFMGTYSLVEFGPDGFTLTTFANIYTLPNDTLDLPRPPAEGLDWLKHFRLRDANWWIDFPTSARTMMELWQTLGQPSVDGIVAVDIPMVRGLLEIFGPITVPETDVPLTAENVLEQLVNVVNAAGDTPGRKNSVQSLVTELLTRVAHMSSEQVLPTLESLAISVNEKHIQVYLNEPTSQSALVALGWAGAIDPPVDTTDLLAVANAVVKPGKSNLGVSKTLEYSVVLAGDGSAETTLKLGYAKTRAYFIGAHRQWMGDFVRVHRAPDTKLSGENSGDMVPFADAMGLPTFGHYFRLFRGTTVEVVARSVVPRALRPGPAAEVLGEPTVDPSDGGGVWHYRLLVVKQADLADTDATVTIRAPEGWTVTGSSAWLRADGTVVTTSIQDDTVTVNTAMTQDLVLDVMITHG